MTSIFCLFLPVSAPIFADIPQTVFLPVTRPYLRIVIDNEGATVIDYKFGVERPTHRKQVAGYMHLLQEMGYTTQGYIWYVPTGKVITVET